MRLRCLVAAMLVALAGSAAGAAASRGDNPPAVGVVSVVNQQGIVTLTLSCSGTETCRGTYALPEYDEQPFPFSVGAGLRRSFTDILPGPLHTASTTKKTVRVVLTGTTSSDRSYAFVQKAGGAAPGGGGANDQQNGNDGPHIVAGPRSATEAVRDARGDARSSFQLPVLFDILSASAKRSGNSIVFSIATVQPIGTIHDSYGNPDAPCIEIPFGSPTHYPIFLFGNGQVSGTGNPGQPWPKVPVRISGSTIRWVVPHKYLFRLGFQWRATGGCDKAHVADVAPQSGFVTFRWVAVK